MVVPYFDFENALKFYNLGTWALGSQATRTKDTESKDECKDQESIQLSVPNLWERDKTQENITHKIANRSAVSQQVITK